MSTHTYGLAVGETCPACTDTLSPVAPAMLALHLPMIIIGDRTDVEACYVTHPECAQTVIDTVNDASGYGRLYLYGPTTADTPCMSNACQH